jgi:hypothetical protein
VYPSKLDVSKAFGPEATRRVEGCHVRFGSGADISPSPSPSLLCPRKRTFSSPEPKSALGHKRPPIERYSIARSGGRWGLQFPAIPLHLQRQHLHHLAKTLLLPFLLFFDVALKRI